MPFAFWPPVAGMRIASGGEGLATDQPVHSFEVFAPGVISWDVFVGNWRSGLISVFCEESSGLSLEECLVIVLDLWRMHIIYVGPP